ncbi:uncharacterized protein BDV17DRAFT_295083 [Aspergillus undulatus]|uniref:uncharacterized protein n=1 Tax=Aspergillus undulatus TaxID=1810928 RepID=UPI003CCCBF20
MTDSLFLRDLSLVTTQQAITLAELGVMVEAHTVGQQFFADPSRDGKSQDSTPGFRDTQFYCTWTLANLKVSLEPPRFPSVGLEEAISIPAQSPSDSLAVDFPPRGISLVQNV